MAVMAPRRRRKMSEQKKQEKRSQLCNWACRFAIAMAMVMRLSWALPLTVRATRYCHRNDNGDGDICIGIATEYYRAETHNNNK